MRPINRPAALLPVSAMQTYQISSPRTTHTRPGSCEEAKCKPWKNGWLTIVPKGSPQESLLRSLIGRHAADGLVRHATEEPDAGDGMVGFRFEAGNPCFKASEHRVSLNRPELYLVKDGDWRGSRGLIRRHGKPELWVEDMQETFDAVERRANGRKRKGKV